MKPSAKHYLRHSCIALLSIWAGLVIYVMLGSISGLLTVHDYEFRAWERIRAISLHVWLPWAFLTFPTLWAAAKMPLKPGSWVPAVCFHLCLFLLLSFLQAYVGAQLYYRSGNMSPDMMDYAPWQHTGHILFLDDMFLFNALIYIFLIASQNISNFHSLAQQKELDALRMQGQLTESRLQALLMQVNPHFLFNTLNSISVLIRKQDTERAGAMIEKLSAFFRRTLDTPAEQWVPLHQELAIMDEYLDIEKVRIGQRLTVTREVPEAALNFPVPMLITQPLVENAIRHGVGRKTGQCELRIEARLCEGQLILDIRDSGAGCDFGSEASGKGIGLHNVRERLRQSYGSAGGLRLEGKAGGGVTATLELPDIRLAWSAEGRACA